MKKYMAQYIEKLEQDCQSKKKYNSSEMKDCIIKIQFFQHERLIHLLVTLFFALFTIIFMAFGTLSYIFLIPFFSLIVFDIFYITHYFYLENGVQYMYKLYDTLRKNSL